MLPAERFREPKCCQLKTSRSYEGKGPKPAQDRGNLLLKTSECESDYRRMLPKTIRIKLQSGASVTPLPTSTKEDGNEEKTQQGRQPELTSEGSEVGQRR